MPGIQEKDQTMRARLVLLAIGLLVLMPSVAGAATPVSPTPGEAVTSSNPTFTWSEPVGLTTDYLRIASAPDVTPDGSFYSQNIIDTGIFITPTLTWAPTRPLYAGAYWWTVESHDASYNQTTSAALPFSVAEHTTLDSIALRSGFIGELRAKWTTNTHAARLTLRIYRGSRLVASQVKDEDVFEPTSQDESSFIFTLPKRLKKQNHVRLVVTLKAGAVTSTRTIKVTVR